MAVSSGCVRLINQDIIDLYDRVPDGAPMVVRSGLSAVGYSQPFWLSRLALGVENGVWKV